MAVRTLYKLIAANDRDQRRINIPLPGLNVCAIEDAEAPTPSEIAAYLGFSEEYANRVSERYKGGYIATGGSAFASEPMDIFGSQTTLPAGWYWLGDGVMRRDVGEHPRKDYSHDVAHSTLTSMGAIVEGSLESAFLGQFEGMGFRTQLPHGTLGISGGDDTFLSLYDSTKVAVRYDNRVYRQGMLHLGGNTWGNWVFYTPCSSTPHAGAISILESRFGPGTEWLLAGHGMIGGYSGVPDGLVMWREGQFWHGIADLRTLRAGLVLLCQDVGADPATVIPSDLTTESLAQPLTISICDRMLWPPPDCFSKYSEVRGESELEDYRPFASSGDDRQVRKIRLDVSAMPAVTTFARFQAERVFPYNVTAKIVGGSLVWMVDGAAVDNTSMESTIVDVENALEDGATCDFAAIQVMVDSSELLAAKKQAAYSQINYLAKVKPIRGLTAVQLAYDKNDADWSWFWCYGPKHGRETAKFALYVMRAAFGLVDAS